MSPTDIVRILVRAYQALRRYHESRPLIHYYIGDHVHSFLTKPSAQATMFSRASQPASSSTARPEVTFQDDVADMYAESLISAQRAAKLLNKAANAGVKGISRKVRKLVGKNQARDYTRQRLKHNKWPDYYFFNCRVLNRRNLEEYTAAVPMLLPLEILEVLWELGVPSALLKEDNLDSDSKSHMRWMREQLSVDQLLGFGIHGDGVPCNYDRTESVVMISINLPGVSGRNGRMRIPLVVLPDHAISGNTYDDIMEVFAWSMRHLLIGSRPTCRHDGSPWKTSDRRRLQVAGTKLDFQACLNQVRADWDFMGKCFHLPFHNVKEGCCWLCNVKRNQVLWDIS